MGRLFLNFAILLLVLLFTDLNEGKPLMIEALQPKHVSSQIDNSNFEDIHSWSNEDRISDNERQKRNCFLYAMKTQNRASKWMCW
ncbi:hypothetical protein I4U23_001785 [Adineta vaga]|nr:hypothetical protein I4U23_001785 [Adineta vaga]